MSNAVVRLTLLAIAWTVLLASGNNALCQDDALECPISGFSECYEEVTANLPSSYAGPDLSLPIGLTGVKYADAYSLSSVQEDALSRNGFVVAPAGHKQFHYIYESAEYEGTPIFATVDAVYHVYHLMFDKLLRDLERQKLGPAIELLTAAMVDEAEEMYDQARGTSLEGAAYGVLGFFSVAEQLIGESPPTIPEPVKDVVSDELKLIDEHGGIAVSPLFSYREDYSQYNPRGHYTREEKLKRYFRTMMWYGRANFSLKDPDLARMALLVNHLIANAVVDGEPAVDLWASVYEPTVFLVGKADDLGIYDLMPLMADVYGPSAEVQLYADDSLLVEFARAAAELPPPKINSMIVDLSEDKEAATKGFRFMGQRFVLDAYIFDELTMREVEERWLPCGLDVFAAMGNEGAYGLLDEMGETSYDRYDIQLAKLQDEISSLGIGDWTQNLYWNWLYALQAVASPKGDAFPPFMRTDAWARKDLHSALGSWTELKHDTILYAKQSYAQCGADLPELVRGYVEPNPEAFARLLALTRMTKNGLESHDLLTDGMENNLRRLDEKLVFLQDMAERELAGEEIPEEDYWNLFWFGGWLETMTMSAADSDEEGGTPYFEQDERAALVADVATAMATVLEEAIGPVFEIYVVVPDGFGGLQVAKGGVFSYYEFSWDASDRLTDEKWFDMIDEGTIPERPSWTKAFIIE